MEREEEKGGREGERSMQKRYEVLVIIKKIYRLRFVCLQDDKNRVFLCTPPHVSALFDENCHLETPVQRHSFNTLSLSLINQWGSQQPWSCGEYILRGSSERLALLCSLYAFFEGSFID